MFMLDGMRFDTSPHARTNLTSGRSPPRHSHRRGIALLAAAAITSAAACGDSEPAADAGNVTTAGEFDATSTTPVRGRGDVDHRHCYCGRVPS